MLYQFSWLSLLASSPVGGDLLVHVLELLLVPQTVHVLVPPEVQPAGLVDHQVGPLGVLLQAGVVVPELQLAAVAHDQGLHVVPPELRLVHSLSEMRSEVLLRP